MLSSLLLLSIDPDLVPVCLEDICFDTDGEEVEEMEREEKVGE